MKQYELIIFDWDGTLMDSVDRIVSSMISATKVLSLPEPEAEQVKNLIGISLPQIMKILYPQSSKQQVNDLIAEYKIQYRTKDATPTPLFDNAEVLLAKLRDKGKLLAVATGKGRNGLERVWQMTNTKHYFHSSRCSDETKSKPDPEMLHQLLHELSIPVEKAIMIGDTSHDLEMAKQAGMASIGITHGVHPTAVLAKYQPKKIVNSLAELENLLL